jgi:hypothetical protein
MESLISETRAIVHWGGAGTKDAILIFKNKDVDDLACFFM